VFLRNHRDLDHLLSAIHTYSSASNAHLNFHKTEAISLSGQPLPQWQQPLQSRNIFSWHDRHSPFPFIHLGFPIIFSLKQCSIAFEKLETTFSSACNIHSQRNLSVRGRATVLNTLIFSKLSHVLRLTTFPQQQIHRLLSIGSRFINHHIFPPLSLATLRLPRKQGGLQVLNLISQQQALQWRWASTLLHSSSPSNSLSPASFLRYTFEWF
ncbi:hypothetical protein A0J61_11780, partial [Choanephora cucurbitarum]